jgi:hypothetical protein
VLDVHGGLVKELIWYLSHHVRFAGLEHLAHTPRRFGVRRVALLQFVGERDLLGV